MSDLLDREQISMELESTPGWTLDGKAIRRTFTFKNFGESMHFVNAVAEMAETANHHPDIDIRWNKVTLALSTHSKGGLTTLDFDLAGKIDAFC